MLAYLLAIAVGLSSLTLFGYAFFSPDLHRKDDFLWSGIGLFYALVLWTCAGRITGAVLLGQTAAATLIFVLGWQTLKLRQALIYPEQAAEGLNFSVLQWLQNRFGPVTAWKPSNRPIPQAVPAPEKPATPQPVENVIPDFEEFDLESSDEDVTETSEIRLENPPTSNKVVVGIYDSQDMPPEASEPPAED